MKGDLHIPSLKEEEARNEGSQWWLGRTKGSAIPPWVPSVMFFIMLDHRCCAPYLGERSRTCLQLVIWRDLPPQLFLYLLYSNTKVETNKDSTGFEHRGVYTLFNEKTKVLEAPNFIFIFILLLFFIYIFLYSWDGKVDMMGNLAGWRHE